MNSTDSTPNLPAQGKGSSPFDTIRRVDASGEWWSARELLPILGYAKWERVPMVLARAEAAAKNSGLRPEEHFRPASQMVPIGSGAERELQDIALTRYGAYLVAMNGDPRKSEIADAQTYFAVQTRKAEILQMPTHAAALRAWASELEAREEAERRAALLDSENKILAPKAGKWDQFLNSEGLIGMTPLADILGIHVNGLTEYLVEINVFRKQVSRFGSNHNMPRRAYQTSGHFKVMVETNGKVSFEVAYATPLGADLVADLWEKRAAA